MHKSRLIGIVIDCEKGDLEKSTAFWAGAFGKEINPVNPKHPTYRELKTRPDEPQLLVQQVDHPPRVHLDIESDDLEKEVARLEKLGAKRIGFVKNWWVLEAPTGHRFCVVNPQKGPLDDRATQWP